jgi:hypothetical protein
VIISFTVLLLHCLPLFELYILVTPLAYVFLSNFGCDVKYNQIVDQILPASCRIRIRRIFSLTIFSEWIFFLLQCIYLSYYIKKPIIQPLNTVVISILIFKQMKYLFYNTVCTPVGVGSPSK